MFPVWTIALARQKKAGADSSAGEAAADAATDAAGSRSGESPPCWQQPPQRPSDFEETAPAMAMERHRQPCITRGVLPVCASDEVDSIRQGIPLNPSGSPIRSLPAGRAVGKQRSFPAASPEYGLAQSLSRI